MILSQLKFLKDASATSIYGARGANGVVLVTTKQGKSGKPKVSIGAKVYFATSDKEDGYVELCSTGGISK